MRQKLVMPIAALAALLAFGCAKGPNDAAIVTNIKSQMFSDPSLKDSNLQVTSTKGQVTLSGTVTSDTGRYEAYKIATQTEGVSKVNDEMSVAPAQEPAPAEPAVTAAAASPQPAPKPERARKARMRKSVPESAPELADNAAPEPQPEAPPIEPTEQPTAVVPPAPQPMPPPPPPQPIQVQIPASTDMTIRMIDGVSSATNHAGEIFHASLESPIIVNNQVVVPKGADVYVRLVSASSAGHIKGKSELQLELVKLQFQGRSYPLVSNTYSTSGDSRGKNTAKKVGGGAVLGALIGAIAAGGKGAAIGTAVGAGGGAVYQGATKGKQVQIPSESKLDFQLQQSVTVTVMSHVTPAAQQ